MLLKPRKRYTSRLGSKLEEFETRTLLSASVVTVQLVGHNLTVTGDSAANDISVSQNQQGNYVIHGNNSDVTATPGVAGLTQDNAGQVTVTARGVSNVSIQMNGGADQLLLDNSTVTGKLTVDLGAGDDQFGIQHSTIKGNVQVQAGDGANVIAFGNSIFNGATQVDMSAGHDSFFQSGKWFDSSRQGNVFNGTLVVKGGGGFDTFVDFDGVYKKAVFVDLGAGDDVVILDGTTLNGGSGFVVGNGNDTLVVHNTHFNPKKLNGFSGF